MAAAGAILLLACPFAQLRAQEQPASAASVMERVRLSEDGTKFVMAQSGAPFAPWGFNFVGEAKEGQHPWLLGELEGFYFVQRIRSSFLWRPRRIEIH